MAQRAAKPPGSPARALANRVAWLYLNRGLTQQEVADRLGISRASVIRLITEARATGEVQIMLQPGVDNDIPLALDLEDRFGLSEAIVVPPSDRPEVAVGRALGELLSQAVAPGMTIGVGWGRTLDAALARFAPGQTPEVTVCSLIGGLVELNTRNPVEFAWRFAESAHARCLLMLSPVFLDSPATRQKLVENTELAALFRRVGSLDIAVLGCGDVAPGGSSTIMKDLPPATQAQLRQAGATAEVLGQFLTLAGQDLGYPEADRLMAADLASIAQARAIVLAGGGKQRAAALAAACRRFRNVTLVTDSPTARAMLEL